MRRWILGSIVGGALAGFMPLPAHAEQYNLGALVAHGDGDTHENNDDPSVAASGAYAEANGSESYTAGADLSQGGALYATASRSGELVAGTDSPRAAAGFSETIFIDEVPSGPIVIRAFLGAVVQATATGGFGAVAQANASLRLDAFAGSCRAAMSANSVSGHEDNSSCSAANSSASAGLVELTVTPETLDDFNYQIYIDGSVEAKFEGVANLDQGSASATGGAGFAFARSPRGTEVIPGLVYIEIDPPTAHSFVNELTVFPVPEPGAPLLAAVGAATLAACRRRGRAV